MQAGVCVGGLSVVEILRGRPQPETLGLTDDVIAVHAAACFLLCSCH